MKNKAAGLFWKKVFFFFLGIVVWISYLVFMTDRRPEDGTPLTAEELAEWNKNTGRPLNREERKRTGKRFEKPVPSSLPDNEYYDAPSQAIIDAGNRRAAHGYKRPKDPVAARQYDEDTDLVKARRGRSLSTREERKRRKAEARARGRAKYGTVAPDSYKRQKLPPTMPTNDPYVPPSLEGQN